MTRLGNAKVLSLTMELNYGFESEKFNDRLQMIFNLSFELSDFVGVEESMPFKW